MQARRLVAQRAHRSTVHKAQTDPRTKGAHWEETRDKEIDGRSRTDLARNGGDALPVVRLLWSDKTLASAYNHRNGGRIN